MNFGFSEELTILRDQARQFLRVNSPPAAARKVMMGKNTHDLKLWSAIAEMGWTGATIPEEYGGSGLGHLALCVLAEELGYAIAPIPFSSTLYLATETLLLAGTDKQKSRWLPLIASGKAIGTFAVSEGVESIGLDRMRTKWTGGRVSGVKIPVPDGGSADFAIVAAKADEGICLCLVELNAAGTERELVSTLDPSRSHAKLSFSNAPAELIGAIDAGSGLLEQVYDRAAVLFSFEQVGGAQAALDMARNYALERYAFGRPLGSFQAIKHKLADLFVAVELARSNSYFGAWALSRNASELPIAAATARACATDAYWLAAKENIQTHGGLGFSWEADCHLHYRRAKILALVLGNSSEWKSRLIGHIETARRSS